MCSQRQSAGLSLWMTWLSGFRPPVPASYPDSCSSQYHAWKDGARRMVSRFSTTKTVAVHFCRRHCSDLDLGIRLYREPVPTQPAAKFLGVLFDRRLTYKEHFKVLRERCFKSLNVLKCVSRTSYGADRSTLLLLYRAIIRSKLDYACFIYDSAVESSKRSLDTIHHTALRVATGAFRTSPAASLLAEANEPPLLLRRQMLGMRYVLKIRQFPDHPAYPYIFSHGFLSLFGGSARKYTPMCIRTHDLREKSGITLRGVMRCGTSKSPPWKSVRPQVDLSLSGIRKGDLHPLESRSRAVEHISSYVGFTASYTDAPCRKRTKERSEYLKIDPPISI